ncbi:MAG: hypothetical protein H8E66_01775 [Planctomycetes bacterium]|nr:hypothetical protein [Planctomycetota bacterium]
MTEVVMATLIVGLMLVPAMNNVGASLRSRIANVELHDGRALAQQLMTEALQARYEDPQLAGEPIGTDSGEGISTREDWDDVDDYDTWSKSPPEDKSGNVLTSYHGWTRSVTADWVNKNDPHAIIGTDQGLKRITVSATSPSGALTTLIALRSSAGVMEQEPVGSGEVTYLTWADCKLQIGDSSDVGVSGGVNIINHAESP